MIYLDSSAILKLIVPEPESAALFGFLAGQVRIPLVSSELATVEVHRALTRMGKAPDDEQHTLADSVLADIDQLPLAPVIRTAALLPGRLRSLDALHLATAQQLPSVTSVVSYDQRLAEHVVAAGLRVDAPASFVDEPE
ncbi:MAG: type II toxin-antitoxin system VapC family toxin [Geodermatophilaceae bacterium]|nr:type II toxin-antitoxin system VapC family toxin [Geodermatophilaceae bacterium]